MINPVKSNSPSIISSLQKAKKAGIKIIVVDAPISQDVKVDTTIVSDNYQAGVLIAQDMMKRLPSANILLLEHRNAVSAMDRIQGFIDTIEKQPSYKIISQKETLGQTEESMPQVKSALLKIKVLIRKSPSTAWMDRLISKTFWLRLVI